MRKTLVW